MFRAVERIGVRASERRSERPEQLHLGDDFRLGVPANASEPFVKFIGRRHRPRWTIIAYRLSGANRLKAIPPFGRASPAAAAGSAGTGSAESTTGSMPGACSGSGAGPSSSTLANGAVGSALSRTATLGAAGPGRFGGNGFGGGFGGRRALGRGRRRSDRDEHFGSGWLSGRPVGRQRRSPFARAAPRFCRAPRDCVSAARLASSLAAPGRARVNRPVNGSGAANRTARRRARAAR